MQKNTLCQKKLGTSNQQNTYLNYYEKIKFKVIHIFCQRNVCSDKLTNLKFINREPFYCTLVLEFFMDIYSLSMYCFWTNVSYTQSFLTCTQHIILISKNALNFRN